MPPVHNYDKYLQEDVQWGVDTGSKKNPGGGLLFGTQVGLHSLAVGQLKVSQVWAPAAVPSLGTVSTTVSVPGAALGDFAEMSLSIDQGGLMHWAYVSAANVVTVNLFNPSGASIEHASFTVNVLVFKAR